MRINVSGFRLRPRGLCLQPLHLGVPPIPPACGLRSAVADYMSLYVMVLTYVCSSHGKIGTTGC